MSRTSRTSLNRASSPEPAFTQDDILASLRDAFATRANPEGLSRVELADALGLSVKKTGELLQRVHRQGKLAAATAYRLAMDGRMRPVPVYRLKN